MTGIVGWSIRTAHYCSIRSRDEDRIVLRLLYQSTNQRERIGEVFDYVRTDEEDLRPIFFWVVEVGVGEMKIHLLEGEWLGALRLEKIYSVVLAEECLELAAATADINREVGWMEGTVPGCHPVDEMLKADPLFIVDEGSWF